MSFHSEDKCLKKSTRPKVYPCNSRSLAVF
nr:MAG TPA: hypothetical protein [Crassvirales sp.]